MAKKAAIKIKDLTDGKTYGKRMRVKGTLIEVKKDIYVSGTPEDFIGTLREYAKELIDSKVDLITINEWGDEYTGFYIIGWRQMDEIELNLADKLRVTTKEQLNEQQQRTEQWERQQYEKLKERFE